MYLSEFYRPDKNNLTETSKRAIVAWIIENRLPAGTKLPSERELASMFKVGKITVNAALAQLKEHGIVETIPRRGTFLKTALKRPCLVDVYFQEDWRAPMLGFDESHHSYYLYRELLDGVLRGSSDFDMSINFEFLDVSSPVFRSKRSLVRDGVALMGSNWPVEQRRELRERGTPYVQISSSVGKINNYVGGSPEGMATGLDELHALGHRSFGLLSQRPSKSVTQAFHGWAERRRVAVRPEAIIHFEGKISDAEIFPLIREFLSQPELPTAVVTTSPIHARAFFRLANEAGLAIPDDISLLHCGSPHGVKHLGVKLSIVNPRYFAIAHEGMKGLRQAIDSGDHVLDPALVESTFEPGETFAAKRNGPSAHKGGEMEIENC